MGSVHMLLSESKSYALRPSPHDEMQMMVSHLIHRSLLALSVALAFGVSSADAGSKTDAEGFSAEMRGEPSYATGKDGVVEVVIAAKGDFKLNDQFPIKFKLDAAPEGVTYPKDVLKREDGTFDQKTGTFKITFLPSRAGKVKIAGTASLSVCSDKKCLMEKVPLDLEVTVK